ncbi:MAG: acetyl-CoA carboxylase biotin carboxylase subunit, partial [Methanosarcinaceae archaeon]
HMGYVISPFYDSMVAKLSVWGRTRDEAIARMKRALFEYVITGITTNIPFHEVVLDNDAFIKGELTTHFIDDHNILADVVSMVEHDSAKKGTLATALYGDDKKIAAISAAVGSYVQTCKKQYSEK